MLAAKDETHTKERISEYGGWREKKALFKLNITQLCELCKPFVSNKYINLNPWF
jgi:hypothetical protein